MRSLGSSDGGVLPAGSPDRREGIANGPASAHLRTPRLQTHSFILHNHSRQSLSDRITVLSFPGGSLPTDNSGTLRPCRNWRRPTQDAGRNALAFVWSFCSGTCPHRNGGGTVSGVARLKSGRIAVYGSQARILRPTPQMAPALYADRRGSRSEMGEWPQRSTSDRGRRPRGRGELTVLPQTPGRGLAWGRRLQAYPRKLPLASRMILIAGTPPPPGTSPGSPGPRRTDAPGIFPRASFPRTPLGNLGGRLQQRNQPQTRWWGAGGFCGGWGFGGEQITWIPPPLMVLPCPH